MTDIHLHLPADFTAGETERVLRSLPDRYTPKLAGAEPAQEDPDGLASEGFTGHEPLSTGRCIHRWRSGRTEVVVCRYADGWHAGRVSMTPGVPAWAQAREDRDRVITHEAWEDAKRPLTLGGDVEITTALEERWDRARRAYGLPDDGIAAWSLTLRETEGGWEAEAWRSDTTTTNAVGPTAGAALEALASRSGPERRIGLEERLAQLQQHVMAAAVAAAQRDGKADAIAGIRLIFQGRTEPVAMDELEEYLEAAEVQLGLEPEQP